jgi:hypothetical protein
MLVFARTTTPLSSSPLILDRRLLRLPAFRTSVNHAAFSLTDTRLRWNRQIAREADVECMPREIFFFAYFFVLFPLPL